MKECLLHAARLLSGLSLFTFGRHNNFYTFHSPFDGEKAVILQPQNETQQTYYAFYVMAAPKELTAGAPLPLILRFSWPILLGNMLQQTYSIVDAAIVGRYLGIDALAAVGASTSVVFLILGFCNGCSGGFGIPIAQKFGARDYPALRRYVNISLQLTTAISLFLAIVTSLLCAPILRGMQTPESIFEGAYIYLLITFIGIPFTFFYNLLSSIIRALGDSQTPFLFLLLATVLNIGLDLLCIVTFGWGVAGAAIATVAAQGISAGLCYIFMKRRFTILESNRQERRFDRRIALTLLSVGAPMGLQFSITAIGSIMLQMANNALGTAAVAAFTAGARIKIFIITPMESLGMAMATYSGQNYGAGLPDRVKEGVAAAMKIAAVYCIVMGLLMIPAAKPFTLLFVDGRETEILGLAVKYIHLSLFFFPFLAMLCILRYTIQGVGYTSFAMGSGVAEMIARTLVSLLAVPAWGYTAVCYGDGLAWLAAVIFLIPAYRWVCNRFYFRAEGCK